MAKSPAVSPFEIINIRRFMAFRVFFNARFYYPVFSILFLDFGITLSQFAVLNAVWAGTIVLCEVPSGAMADAIGRRKLLVFAGALMVGEMALFAFAPRGNSLLLFSFLLANRILSGTAEACASGADEALAFDTLKREGDIAGWGRVLEVQMRIQAAGFIVVMIVGGAVYDVMLVQKVSDFLGLGITITRETTLRFPIYLSFLMALLALTTALRMTDVSDETCPENMDCSKSILSAFRLTLQTTRWIAKTPFVLIVILTGFVFDSSVRMVITMGSQYYRLIQIPEAFFGIIGSSIALMGIFLPRIARRLAEHRSPLFNLGLMAVLCFSGLIGMSFFFPLFGLVPALVLFSNMFFLNFFLSHYLNRAASSEHRATVLSFKGLALNLGFGFIGILYSLLLALLRSEAQSIHPELTGDALTNAVFISSIAWFPGYLGTGLVILLLFAGWELRKTREYQ
ncbi:MAG: MFS transporter [Pseudomonadota bacterium]